MSSPRTSCPTLAHNWTSPTVFAFCWRGSDIEWDRQDDRSELGLETVDDLDENWDPLSLAHQTCHGEDRRRQETPIDGNRSVSRNSLVTSASRMKRMSEGMEESRPVTTNQIQFEEIESDKQSFVTSNEILRELSQGFRCLRTKHVEVLTNWSRKSPKRNYFSRASSICNMVE